MEKSLKELDELFDSIIDEIEHPEKSGIHKTPAFNGAAKNGLGFSEAASVISVIIADDAMSAKAMVIAGGANPRIRTADEIMAVIKSKGITYGIDEEAVKSIADSRIFNKGVVIAKGTPAVNGVDGSIKPLFDCRGGKEVKNISADTELCHIIPPTKGVDGSDILGRNIPSQDGKPAPAINGDNTVMEGNVLKSTASGTLAVRDGLYSILNEMVINNDVTAAMGIVSFVGTIIVRGNVRDKSVIRAGKGVVINGYAFGAVIEAGTDITIAKSTENTVLVAADGFIKGRDFKASALSAGRNISAVSLEDCKVCAVTGIECMDSNGSICGGEIECTGSISCYIVGSRKRELTSITLGDRGEYAAQLERCHKQYDHICSEVDKVERRIKKLEKERKDGSISLDDDNFLAAAVKIIEQIKAERIAAKKRLERVEEILALSEKASLTVKTMLHANVAVNIRGKRQTTENDRGNVIVSANNHGIVIT